MIMLDITHWLRQSKGRIYPQVLFYPPPPRYGCRHNDCSRSVPLRPSFKDKGPHRRSGRKGEEAEKDRQPLDLEKIVQENLSSSQNGDKSGQPFEFRIFPQPGCCEEYKSPKADNCGLRGLEGLSPTSKEHKKYGPECEENGTCGDGKGNCAAQILLIELLLTL
jgi:hypothetical protein